LIEVRPGDQVGYQAASKTKHKPPNQPATVGKPASPTDNAQFFHQRIEAPPRSRLKEKTMKDTIRQLIQQAITQLVTEGVLPEGLSPAIQVENTRDKTHGDFASNIAMMLAKPAGMKPRDLAEKIITALPSDENVTKAEIAGPGFINFFQNTQALASRLDAALADERIGVRKAGPLQRTIVDLSAPNLAKEMHVGHLRSTIIGDGVARVLEFLGDTVIRQNHVGDWGTQFGMLMAYLQENPYTRDELSDLENFYRAAKQRFDESPEFADRARGLVVKLQAGDAECLALWTKFKDISLSHCQKIYELLNVKLTMADVMGESAYNDDLVNVVNDLRAKGMLVESNGAQCVFLDQFKTADGEPLPVIIVKADGGYLYATTDLAAVRYRSGVLKADRALYFVDQRQALHFQQVFEVARLAGFVTHPMEMEHMGFGTMNGADGRPFKTRDGGTVKLIDLLTEAQDRAYTLVKGKNPDLAEDELRKIAKVVGIDAVKYADLSKHRTSDYSFNFDLMLNFEGNTAPYLLYAYTRVAGVFRKLGKRFDEVEGQIVLEATHEQELAAKLAQFGEVLNNVADKGTPHTLCAYLYDVAGLFSSFYENCPILNADTPEQMQSRLRLAALTGRTLKQGLELLGLETLERM
jgi:arginyl-tRNA synthetase